MVFPKDRRLWVYPLLIMFFVLLWTESQSLNGATHVGTLTGTYPSGHSRILSELSFSSNDSIFGEKQNTNGNHHTSRNSHRSKNQKSNSHGKMHTRGNMSNGNLLDRSDDSLLDSSNGTLPDRSDASLYDRSDESLRDRSDVNLRNRSDVNLRDRSDVNLRDRSDVNLRDRSDGTKDRKPHSQRSHGTHAEPYSGTVYSSWRNLILERYKPMLPYGCTIEDISENHRNKNTLDLPYESLFYPWLSKKKAFISYFYYGIYLERKYYVMVDDVNKWFSSVAKDNNLPDDYKLQWWEECNKALLHDLECIQNTFDNLFRNFVAKRKGKYIWTIPFENLLNRFYKLTYGSVVQNRAKWITILTQKMRTYRSRTNRKHITQQR
ncbi:Uncharacterized protein PCOAH_00015360 [Plasmodium coatneyi]|uniref:Plasmodium RESA N-terminal domain-containing protein n=1 Tax=Plasmodium coatneyi TaxID=208452 RepID=A0A1B1DX71_9APIC|nr:Uncharacterized protein PCOAH_00015360 [Plasmodium coatneyi]ANQ07207.1 Uncharacterized protein PCOAH_00015360 [Plasmodium coatneyi]